MFGRLFRKTKPQEIASMNAILDAQQHLDRIRDRGEAVSVVVKELRTARERNHFSEQIAILKSRHV